MKQPTNKEIDAVAVEIKAVTKKLTDLRAKRLKLVEKERERRRGTATQESKKRQDKHLELLSLAAGGMPVAEIARTRNVSKHSLRDKLQRVWRQAFPEHFAKTEEDRSVLGLLGALRAVPPPFAPAQLARKNTKPATKVAAKAASGPVRKRTKPVTPAAVV